MMVDPTSAEHQQDIEDALDVIGTGIELSVLLVIVERLAKSDGKTVAEVFAEIPKDMARIERILEQGAEVYTAEVLHNLDVMADANDDWAKPFYEARKVEQVKHATNKVTGSVVKNAKTTAAKNVSAMCDTSVLGFAVPDGKGYKCIGMKDAYKAVVRHAVTAMKQGESTYQTAVSRAVTALSNNGLRVMYPGGNTMELYAAVRMNVMDNYRQTLMEMREIQGDEFGADGYEVSAHEQCAPDHQPYQGQQYPKKIWEAVKYSPDSGRPLIDGANCKHTAYPIIMGISSPAYTKAQIAKMNASSERNVTYTGLDGSKRTSSRYEATQYQRTVERRCRQLDTREALDRARGDTEAANKAKEERRATLAHYRSMSKEMGLTTREERTRAYVMG